MEAVQAYMGCDKNKEFAANFLLSEQADMMMRKLS